MTAPAHAAAIGASLEIAADRGGDLTKAVYVRLFERHPGLRAQFWRDSDGAIKGEMLARTFEAILDYVGERRYGHHLIQSEAVNHEGWEIPRETFTAFFAVVADAVRDACGPRWTPAMEEAWRGLLGDLSACVARAGAHP